MTGKEYRSLARCVVVLALAMVAGFILLAMVVNPSLWVVILFSVVILALLFFMFHSLKKLEKSIEKGKDNEKK